MTKYELIEQMQIMSHNIGAKAFLGMIAETFQRAADDTSDFDFKEISNQYKKFANDIYELRDEMEKE